MSEGQQTRASNKKMATWLIALALGMVGFSFALIPLYGLYCKVVGVNKVTTETTAAVIDPSMKAGQERWVTVEFDANVNGSLPWEFEPMQRSVRVKIGEPTLVKYRVRNLANETIVAQAIPAVTPWQTTGFLHKLECFCFNRQKLEAGESQEMPLRFVVSSDLPEKYDAMVLSYTFLNADKKSADKYSGFEQLPPIENL